MKRANIKRGWLVSLVSLFSLSCARTGPTLPNGFSTTIFADNLGSARHIVVAPNGDVFVNAGKVVALRDTNHDGRADIIERDISSGGGTGIALHGGFLYVDEGSQIVRYPLPAGSLRPSGPSEVVISDIPTRGHGARNFVIDSAFGALFLNVGSKTNSCQQQDRTKRSPGVDPCTELETRAGIWRFDANATNQTFSPANRFATGLRNSIALAVAPDGKLWAAVHGRDQLSDNWGFDAKYNAENPGEELVQINEGDDFGWPYCYYSTAVQKLVTAPEYGGDGTRTDRCVGKKAPVAALPGHWAPMSVLFYTGSNFPARYREGVFIAFHGSWNRAPEPQEGFRVVFVPLSGTQQAGDYETFMSGFKRRFGATYRPVGLAQDRDGAIYVTDDTKGRVWRVMRALTTTDNLDESRRPTGQATKVRGSASRAPGP